METVCLHAQSDYSPPIITIFFFFRTLSHDKHSSCGPRPRFSLRARMWDDSSMYNDTPSPGPLSRVAL